MPYFRFPGRSPSGEDFEPDIFGIHPLETVDCETLHLFTSKTDKAACTTFAGQTVSPGKPRRSSGTSAPEGKGTYNCLIGLYLSTNGLFGTVIDVAVSYVFS